MKTLLKVFVLTFLFLGNVAIFGQGKDLFSEVERIELKFKDIYFAVLGQVRPLPDGFIALCNESRTSGRHKIIKFDKQGNVLSIFQERGNGPGELRSVANILVTNDSILVAESTAPYVHKFSHKLEFIEDFRIKKGGKIFNLGSRYFGIWGPKYKNVNGKDKIFMLALYEKDSFTFKRDAFDIKEEPALTFNWGGICKIDKNRFAGIYANEYKIRILDEDGNQVNSLIKEVPGHFKKYYKWNKDPNNIDSRAMKWMHSWSKMHAVFFLNEIIIIRHNLNRRNYLDFYSRDGALIKGNWLQPKSNGHVFTTDGFIWKLQKVNEDDDDTRYFLVKEKLNL